MEYKYEPIDIEELDSFVRHMKAQTPVFFTGTNGYNNINNYLTKKTGEITARYIHDYEWDILWEDQWNFKHIKII